MHVQRCRDAVEQRRRERSWCGSAHERHVPYCRRVGGETCASRVCAIRRLASPRAVRCTLCVAAAELSVGGGSVPF